jgi:hypothetical protein
VFHYTDRDGYNAIISQPTWRFEASQLPGNHPFGAYFTDLPPETRNLSKRLGLPRRKLAYYLEFIDAGDLKPLPGNRGEHIFYSPDDYEVSQERQIGEGETGR